MNSASFPLVSVVTPVYNGDRYLAECIESVLKQTYSHWEYLIVNNSSTDRTLDIANRYASLDERIHIYSFEEFVDVIGSYNRALRLISPQSKYCKVVAADDWLYPECIEQMVQFAEANPSVGIVGAYTLEGGASCRLKFDGLPYQVTVVSGREACRSHLLGGRYFLGTPTSVLYRSDLVTRTTNFFPNSREHADVSVFYECLRNTDLGFVHQVLTHERIHENALGAEARRLSTYFGSHLLDVRKYGSTYLTKDELKNRLDQLMNNYYELLAESVINRRDKRFWSYHKQILDEFESPLSTMKLTKAVCLKLADLLLNPKLTIEKMHSRRERLSKS